jgi:hypothetical protein
MQMGDRVKFKFIKDELGQDLYGTVLDPKALGFCVYVVCDMNCDPEYCFGKEILVLKEQIEVVDEHTN